MANDLHFMDMACHLNRLTIAVVTKFQVKRFSAVVFSSLLLILLVGLKKTIDLKNKILKQKPTTTCMKKNNMAIVFIHVRIAMLSLPWSPPPSTRQLDSNRAKYVIAHI